MHPDIALENKIFVKPNYTDMSFFTEENIDLWGDKYHETIELHLKEGDTLSIPPYWLYSFVMKKKVLLYVHNLILT